MNKTLGGQAAGAGKAHGDVLTNRERVRRRWMDVVDSSLSPISYLPW